MDPFNDMEYQYEAETQPEVTEEVAASESPVPLGRPTLDTDAVKKSMLDFGFDEEDFTAFHWDVTRWNDLGDRVVSPEFECAGYRFRILMFPWGNGLQHRDYVSIYLDCADFSNPLPVPPEGVQLAVASQEGKDDFPPETIVVPVGTVLPKGKKSYEDHVCIQFELAFSNPSDPSIEWHCAGHHRYTPEETDWGFSANFPLQHMATPVPGKGRPIIEGQAVRVSAFLRATKDEKGFLWHNFANYNSKKETGYVGIKNQGATCYMNSLLQSLYCTPMFRRAVYEIPTENDTPSSSAALALQRVFYRLQSSHLPVGTNELTKSFGWKSLDSFLQHDVQEFNRVLQDSLEEKMKGTAADGMIAKLFVGKMKSYIKCVNVAFESSRSEDFYDIQLNVKGMSTLLDSFRNYIQVERLDGDNQYHAEGYGLQDADKGVIFESLPRVLHLQLKRFEYDFERDTMVKINDRHEFPLEIDLADFIDQDSPVKNQGDWKYSLHGVLVHSGDLSSGHYFALLKPEADGAWYKFDDDRVTPATYREVLEDNYGGEPHVRGQPLPKVEGQKPIKRFTNAYMLVYIRNSAKEDVLKPVSPEETPSHLAERIEQERAELETRRREREEAHLYLNLRIITPDMFQQYSGFDLTKTSDQPPYTTVDVPSFKVPRSESYQSIKAQLAQKMNLDPSEFRAWYMVNRQNKTIRPEDLVPDDDPSLTMEQIRDQFSSRGDEVRLYLEPLDAVPAEVLTSPKTHSLLFLKHFDPVKQTLVGVSHVYVQNDDPVRSLETMVRQVMEWPESTVLKLYEEIKPKMIDSMKLDWTFAASEIVNGDIVCFQEAIPAATAVELESKGMCSDPIQFYDFLLNKEEVTFKPVPGSQDLNSDRAEFTQTLHKALPYDALALRVGAQLGAEPTKIRFLLPDGTGGVPLTAIESVAPMPVWDIVTANYVQRASEGSIVYYEVLDQPLVEYESKRLIKVYWMGLNNKQEGEKTLLLHKSTTLAALQQLIIKDEEIGPHPLTPTLFPPQLQNGDALAPDAPWATKNELLPSTSPVYNLTPRARVRLSYISADGRTQVNFNLELTLEQLPDGVEVYVDEVPGDEMEYLYARTVEGTQDQTRTLVDVTHFTKDPTRGNGVPFRIVLYAGETLGHLKDRLRARLALAPRDFDKIKVAVVPLRSHHQAEYLDDNDCVPFDLIIPGEQALGLDHLDRSVRSQRLAALAVQDRGIHIRA